MAWHRIADKPLSELMLILFTDAYAQHFGGDEVSKLKLKSMIII